MFKKIAIGLTVATLTGSFVGCNSSSEVYGDILPDNAQISAFSLQADSKVLPNLDSVFFSIDQLTGNIFNADSLPMGTKVKALIPQITVSSASVVELTVSRAGRKDTTYNYLQDSNDSIDFTNPVRLRIVSSDGQCTANYTIKVNVHKVLADTLVWSSMERAVLPTRLNAVKAQRTARTADTFYCLTSDGSSFCLASTGNPQDFDWKYTTPSFGFDAVTETFSASDDALFILDRSNNLYRSTNGGASWTATGRKWNNIIGSFGNTLLGTALQNGRWMTVEYPGTNTTAALSGFPVSGTSQSITYNFNMGQPQMMITGGRTADGTLTGATWSFDGSSWAKISRRDLPYAMEGLTVVPYFTVSLNKNNWTVTRNSRLYAMFGRRQDGKLNDTIYVSRDFGMHWEKADTTLQCYGRLASRANAQGFVYSQTLTPASRSLDGVWTPIITPRTTVDAVRSRATAPITEWECPYIYVFGGVGSEGNLLNEQIRGVITRFTFKPLQ